MSMTKKHYMMIAKAISARAKWANDTGNLYREGAIELVAKDLADQFALDNPNFDRAKFLAACAVPKAKKPLTRTVPTWDGKVVTIKC